MPDFKKMGRKNTATMMSVAAAINSYEAMPIPSAKPEPDMAINCSAEMLLAISEVPITHQLRLLLAMK